MGEEVMLSAQCFSTSDTMLLIDTQALDTPTGCIKYPPQDSVKPTLNQNQNQNQVLLELEYLEYWNIGMFYCNYEL